MSQLTAIVITGNPASGKTSVCTILGDKGYHTVSLFEFARERNCLSTYDDQRDSWIVDDRCLQDNLATYLEGRNGITVLEGHYGDLVPEDNVRKCFVLSVPLGVLQERYKKRGYSKSKIEENLEAQIMEECYYDAVDAFGKDRVVKLTGSPLEMAIIIEREIQQLQGLS